MPHLCGFFFEWVKPCEGCSPCPRFLLASFNGLWLPQDAPAFVLSAGLTSAFAQNPLLGFCSLLTEFRLRSFALAGSICSQSGLRFTSSVRKIRYTTLTLILNSLSFARMSSLVITPSPPTSMPWLDS